MTREPRTFAQALTRRARLAPRQPAYFFGGAALSWGELARRAGARALGLRLLGLRPGDRTVLLLPAGLELVETVAALSLLGAVPAVLNPRLPPPTALARTRRLRPALVVAPGEAPGEALAGLAAAAAGDPEIRLVAAEELPRPGDWRDPSPDPGDAEPAFLQLTSGSTGEPRAAVLTHGALRAWRRLAAEVYAAGEADVLAGWVPPWHVMGLLRFVWAPPFWGSSVHLIEPAVSSLGEWLETIARVGATFTSATDFALRHACRLADPRLLDLRTLRFVASGGEAVRLATVREFEERFGVPGVVRPAYGLAEATMGVTSVRRGEPLRTDSAGTLSCGRPLAGVELRILGEDGAERPRGEAGEIVLRSPTLFGGYFDAPDETRRVLRDGWLHTGDHGRLDEAGELFVVGRQRLLIKHAGAAFAPREIEEAAEAVPAVARAAALGLRRDGGPEQIVVAAEVHGTVARELHALAGELARAVRAAIGVLPGEVLLLRPGTLPVTETGKLRHLVLRERLGRGGLAAPDLLFGRADGWSG